MKAKWVGVTMSYIEVLDDVLELIIKKAMEEEEEKDIRK